MKEDRVDSGDGLRLGKWDQDGTERDQPVIVWKELPELDELRPIVRELSKPKPLHTVRALCFDWAILGSALWLGSMYPHLFVWIPLIVIIAARQHALAVLMHDVAHHRFLKNRTVADVVSNLFMAYPVLLDTDGYRKNHEKHHHNLFTEHDPDWMRKKGHPDWDFPQTKSAFFIQLLRICCGGGVLWLRGLMKATQQKKSGDSGHRIHISIRGAYYTALAILVWYTGAYMAALLWFVSLFTLMPVFARIRSIAEHFGTSRVDDLTMTRSINASWWERLLFAPHCIGLHLPHHLFISVPFYNLRKLNKHLMDISAYRDHAHITRSYFFPYKGSLLEELTITR